MKLRGTAVLLVGTGALLLVALLKLVVFPGLLEFLLITLAHLLMAPVAFGLARATIRGPIGLVAGAVWGIAWLAFGVHEAVMLFFILPPAWLSMVGGYVIPLAGLVAGVAALFLHGGSDAAAARVSRWTTLVVAVAASEFLWLPGLFAALPIARVLAFAADVVAAAVLVVAGCYLLVRHRAVVARARCTGLDANDPISRTGG